MDVGNVEFPDLEWFCRGVHGNKDRSRLKDVKESARLRRQILFVGACVNGVSALGNQSSYVQPNPLAHISRKGTHSLAVFLLFTRIISHYFL
jgi:hypothetical protein